MNNLNNRNTKTPLNHFGSLPDLRSKSNSISPTFMDSRLLPQSAPTATLSSRESDLTEISIDNPIENQTGSETNPTEVLGTLRMHYYDASSWSPSYLQTFFNITNYTGFSPYRYSMHNQEERFGKMVPYIVVSLLSILNLSRVIKKMLLEAATKTDDPDIHFYILLWRSIVQAILRLSAIQTFINGKAISAAMDRMDSTSFSVPMHSKLKFLVGTPFILSSFVMALVGSLFGFPDIHNTGWSIRSLLEYRSKEVEEFFLSTNFNQTIGILLRDPEENLDTSTYMMGLFGCLLKFVGIAADKLDRFSILSAILILHEGVREFHFENMPMTLEVGTVITPTVIGKQIKNSYNDLKKISKSINDIFEGMIDLFLLDSLLLLVDFVGVVFNANYNMFARILLCMQVFTGILILRLGVCISKKMWRFRDWLTTESSPENSGLCKDDIQAMLNELASNPIGVGRETLYINKGFLVGYCGIITGYFFSTVETRGSVCDCR